MLIAAVAALALTGAPKPALCDLPPIAPMTQWGFHVGAPLTGASGTYLHGHGTAAGARASGAICEVRRSPGVADRVVVLTVTRARAPEGHRVRVGGVLGNALRLPVRVSRSTDRACPAGTLGTVALFASYDGPRRDTVTLAMRRPCRTLDRRFSGSQVVVLVPQG
jgi:hypothetical protein